VRALTILEAEYIAHQLALELMDYSEEPIPPFKTRYPHKLESCLAQPFQEYAGEELYPGLYRKAGMLFYLVIKNHPFKNGNKRMAVVLTLTFMYINGCSLHISTNELYRLAVSVAEAEARGDIEIVVAQLEKIFQEYSQAVSR
jgi:death-on-curing family protein